MRRHLIGERVRIFAAMLHGARHRDHFAFHEFMNGAENELVFFRRRRSGRHPSSLQMCGARFSVQRRTSVRRFLGAGTEEPAGTLKRAPPKSYSVSIASRTPLISEVSVNGFCRNVEPGGNHPCRTASSSV